MAKEGKFDDIFESTTGAKKAPAKKAPAKKAAAKKVAKKAAPAPAGSSVVDDQTFDALNTALVAHHEETLQCKAREDRIFTWATALIAAILLSAFVVFYGNETVSWFPRLLIKLLLIGAVALSAVFALGFIENNRKKMRDLLSVVVKINERLGFFTPGRFDDTGEPFYPNTYKFAGSDSEDESGQKTLFLKGAAVFASLVILLFL